MDLSYSMCFWLPVAKKGAFAQLCLLVYKRTAPTLGFYDSWHTHASYASTVCNMEDMLWGEVLSLCSTRHDNVIVDPVVVKSYLEVMKDREVTISKEK